MSKNGGKRESASFFRSLFAFRALLVSLRFLREGDISPERALRVARARERLTASARSVESTFLVFLDSTKTMPRRRRPSTPLASCCCLLLVSALALLFVDAARLPSTIRHAAAAATAGRAMLRRGDGLARAVFRWLGISTSPSHSSTSSSSTARPGHRWDAFLPIPDDPRHLEEEQRARAAISAAAAAAQEGEEEGEGEEEEQQQQQQPPPAFTAVPLPPLSLSPGGEEEENGDLASPSSSFSAPAFSSSQPPTVPWTARNESDAVPLLPKPVMWLLAEAERAVANASSAAARLATAAALARINSVAYCGRASVLAWNCSRCRDSFAGAFDVEAAVYDAGWDLFAFAGYSRALGAPVVAFKGTDSRSVYNWAENMRYWRSDLPLPVPGADGSLVHTGFYASWNSSALAPNLTAAAGRLVDRFPGRPLYVVGHSLGAALATVAAVDMKSRLEAERRRESESFRPLDVRLVTFGSPRVGNAAFASFVRQATRLSLRLTHNRDIVPSVPPTWVGFHHVATEAWQVDIEDRAASKAAARRTRKRKGRSSDGDGVIGVVGLCDASGEDPRCHNSVCYLGLCTSVADHLSYMGAPMLHSDNASEDSC